MTFNGWAQIALFVAVVLLLTRPLGGYLDSVMAGRRTFLSPILLPLERGFYRLAGVDPTRGAELVGLCRRHAGLQCRGLRVPLRSAAAAGPAAAQPAGLGGGAARPRRSTPRSASSPTPTGSPTAAKRRMSYLTRWRGSTVQNFLSAADRHRAGDGADPRLRPRRRQGTRQLLGRSGAHHALRAAADLHRLRAVRRLAGACRRTSEPMSRRRRWRAPGRPSPKARSPRRTRSRCWAPTAAASSTPTPRIRSRTRRRSRTSCRCWRSSRSARRSPTSSAGWSATSARAGRSSRPWACCSWPASPSPTGRRPPATRSLAARSASTTCRRQHGGQGGPLRHRRLRACSPSITTAASCGAVNAMHDSFTPLGGMVPLVNIQLGEVIFGGVGSGLYGMLLFAILAVFIAGPDGRPHAGISRQEDRGARDQAGDARHPLPAARRSWASPRSPRSCRPGLAGPSSTPARTASARSSTPSPRRPATTAAPSPGSPPTRPSTTPRSASRCCSAASSSSCRCWRSPARWPPRRPCRRLGRHLPDARRRCSSACWSASILIVGGLTFFPASRSARSSSTSRCWPATLF